MTDRNVVFLSVATFCLGYVAYIYQSWFYLVAALMAFAGGLMWLAIDAGKKIEVEERVPVYSPEVVVLRDK